MTPVPIFEKCDSKKDYVNKQENNIPLGADLRSSTFPN